MDRQREQDSTSAEEQQARWSVPDDRLMRPERQAEESFEEYRRRRRSLNAFLRSYLRGRRAG